MRIACLQFAPQVGHVSNNISRADQIISEAHPGDLQDLDLLVLPEMAFSGYNFKSLQEIMPYLEPAASGISADWARTMARKYNCVVGVGYPEVVREKQDGQEVSKNYNSLVFIGKDGKVAANYRKSFLYYTDETWALEGNGFYQGKLDGLGKVAMGICMDINPYKFEAPWDAFEFGCHVRKIRANLAIVSMAWLTFADRELFASIPKRPDLETLQYWVRRLEPVMRTDDDSTEEIIVVFANRCGTEDEVLYAGTSTVVGIQNGEVNVYGILGRGEENLLVVDTDKPAFAKLVSSPAQEDDEPSPSSNESSQNTEEDEEESWNREGNPEDPGSAESPPPTSSQSPKDKPQEQLESTVPSSAPVSLPSPTKSRPKLSILTDPKIIAPFSLKPPPIQISPADLYSTLDTPPFSSQDTKFRPNTTIISAIPVSALTPTYTPTEPGATSNWPPQSGDISPWSFGSSSPVQVQEKDFFAEWLVEEPSPNKCGTSMFKRGSQIWRPRDEESPTLGGGGKTLFASGSWGGYLDDDDEEEEEGEEGISPRTVVVGLRRGGVDNVKEGRVGGEMIRIGASPSIWAGTYEEDGKDEEDEYEEEENEYMVKGGILPSPNIWSSPLLGREDDEDGVEEKEDSPDVVWNSGLQGLGIRLDDEKTHRSISAW